MMSVAGVEDTTASWDSDVQSYCLQLEQKIFDHLAVAISWVQMNYSYLFSWPYLIRQKGLSSFFPLYLCLMGF